MAPSGRGMASSRSACSQGDDVRFWGLNYGNLLSPAKLLLLHMRLRLLCLLLATLSLRLLLLLAAVVFVLLGVAACGGQSSDLGLKLQTNKP